MMLKLIIFIALLTLISVTHGETPSVAPVGVADGELVRQQIKDMRGFEEAGSAFTLGASVIETIIRIRVEADGSFTKEQSHTWQIETDKGITNFGEKAIEYSSSKETIEVLKASITQPDGTVIKVSADAIHDQSEELSSGAASFSDTRYKVIVYPQVKVRSRLQFKSTIHQHTPEFPGHFTYVQYFYPQFRYAHEEVHLEISDRLSIKVMHQGGKLTRISDLNGYQRYQFNFRQDHAKPTESAQIDETDYAPYLMASSFEDHIALGQAYQQRAKPMAAVTTDIRKIADEVTAGMTVQREQVKALYHWVASNIRYVFIGLGDGGLVPQPADLVLKNRYGDCKGHVVLLEALLAAKGINSSPALINLGESYRLPPLAILHPFNHVITYVPSLDLYMDSTAQMTPFGYLPRYLMDKTVVLTALNIFDMTPILSADAHAMKSDVRMRLMDDGSIKGSSTTTSSGWIEDDERQTHFDWMHQRHRMIKTRLESYRESGKGKIESVEPQDFSQPFSERTEFTLEPITNIPGPAAMTIPNGPLPFALSDYVLEKPSPASDVPRVCYNRTIEQHHTMTLPDNVKVLHIPKDMKFRNSLTRYESSYQITQHPTGQQIHSIRKLTLDYPNFVCEQADLKQIADLMDVMRRDLRGQIIYE